MSLHARASRGNNGDVGRPPARVDPGGRQRSNRKIRAVPEHAQYEVGQGIRLNIFRKKRRSSVSLRDPPACNTSAAPASLDVYKTATPYASVNRDKLHWKNSRMDNPKPKIKKLSSLSRAVVAPLTVSASLSTKTSALSRHVQAAYLNRSSSLSNAKQQKSSVCLYEIIRIRIVF